MLIKRRDPNQFFPKFYCCYFIIYKFFLLISTGSINLSLGNNKSHQLSRTLWNILSDISGAVIWIASILPQISSSINLLCRFLEVVPRTSILFSISAIFLFFKFFRSLAKSWYELSFSLFVWVLWHINYCRLFNTKSIFIQISSSISNNSV